MRNVMHGFLAAILITGTLAYAPPAVAADYTFTVPVELTDLPPAIQRGYVRCVVRRRDPGVFVDIGAAESPRFEIRGGDYSGTHRIEITVGATFDPRQAHRYDCDLWLQIVQVDGTLMWMSGSALSRDTGPPQARIRVEGRSMSYTAAGPLNGATFP
jgi:hypothetical protein